jgi:dienelactone hydrolase
MTRLLDRRTCLQAATALAWGPCLPPAARAAGWVTDGAWPDAARQRSLPWRLRLPDSPGPWPLVLFSHGLGGSVDAGTVWGEAWAAGGLAVLHLQHPGSDAETLRGGMRQLVAAASAEQWLARVQDVRFALDELARRAALGEPPWLQVRADAIGLAGHSFGAQTTQAVAGQRFPAPGQASDPRPRAFIAFSPSQTRGGRLSVADAFGGITRPFLAVTGSEDGDPFGSYDNGEPRAEVYRGLPPGQRALLWLDGADHMTFAGQNLARAGAFGFFRRRGPAAERQAAHHAVVARITTDWWRAQLLGDPVAQASLRAPMALGAKDRWQLD